MVGLHEAFVVVDLGFGDAGKGTVTDWLVRALGAGLVVRWNGGAQAGHNVVTEDGRHHCFSQLGAGTLVPGVRTHLAETVVVHPTALLVELEHLRRIGVSDARARLTVAAGALVTTPFHQAAGRLREMARGDAPHGTCGVGVGETVRDALDAPSEAVQARHLAGDRDALVARVERVRARLVADLGERLDAFADHPLGAFEVRMLRDPAIAARWAERVAELDPTNLVVPDAHLDDAFARGPVVLEGAQGVLLDQDRGFHPHTTWSDCTATAAGALLARHGFEGVVHRLGVMRVYMTRHGPGPLPTETRELDALAEPHNDAAGFQGAFRRGFPDPVLWRYALEVAGGVDGLAVTHVDRLAARARWPLCTGYGDAPDAELFAHDAGRALRVRTPDAPDLAHQARLARALAHVTPRYEDVAQGRFVDALEAALDRPVWLTSHGPTAADKRPRTGTPLAAIAR